MFEDRRVHPRQKESIALRVALPEGEVSLVTTDLGPTGAFFAGVRKVAPGTMIDVLVRPQGFKIAPVRLHAEIVRVVAPGGPHPPGFAVRWIWALSEAGVEPIYQVLRKVLHIIGLREEHLDGGRKVRFDFPPVGGHFAFRPSLAVPAKPDLSSTRDGGIREEVVSGSRVRSTASWSPTRSDRSSSSTIPASSPRPPMPRVEPEPPAASVRTVAPSHGQAGTDAELDLAALHDDTPIGGTELPMINESSNILTNPMLRAERQRSGGWSTWKRSDAVSVARRTSDVIVQDDFRPIGRRVSEVVENAATAAQRSGSDHFDPASQHGHSGAFDDINPPVRPHSAVFDAVTRRDATRLAADVPDMTAIRRSGVGLAQDDVVAPRPARAASGAHPDTGRTRSDTGRMQRVPSSVGDARGGPGDESPFFERSQIFGRGGHLTTNIGLDTRSHVSGLHVPVEMDLPVTFEHDNRFVPARMVGAASLAVELVMVDSPPDVDERLVVNVPVDVEGRWRTIQLHGKLLRAPTLREDGSLAVVVALERVQEGEFVGSYARLLQDAHAEAQP